MITVISITNDGAGLYTVTFSGPIVNLNPGTPTVDGNILLFSPGIGDWTESLFTAAESGNTIQIGNVSTATDCTLFILLGQPLDLSAGATFQTAIPIITLT